MPPHRSAPRGAPHGDWRASAPSRSDVAYPSMIDLPLLVAFVLAASILTVTPGVDTAMVLRSATVEGRRPAAYAAIGIAAGCLIWGGAVALGFGALLRASGSAYTIVKLAGTGYLIWLGGRLLLRPRTTLEGFGGAETLPVPGPAFRRGFLTNVLNPKVGVFYVSFLPHFVPAGAPIASYSFFLAFVHVLLTLSWFAILIAAAAPLGRLLRRPKALRALDVLTGGVFVTFGLRLATSHAP